MSSIASTIPSAYFWTIPASLDQSRLLKNIQVPYLLSDKITESEIIGKGGEKRKIFSPTAYGTDAEASPASTLLIGSGQNMGFNSTKITSRRINHGT